MPAADFERLVARLLVRLDYQSVRILRGTEGRGPSRRGRTSHGGADIRTSNRTGLSSAQTLVQVKQYRRPVS